MYLGTNILLCIKLVIFVPVFLIVGVESSKDLYLRDSHSMPNQLCENLGAITRLMKKVDTNQRQDSPGHQLEGNGALKYSYLDKNCEIQNVLLATGTLQKQLTSVLSDSKKRTRQTRHITRKAWRQSRQLQQKAQLFYRHKCVLRRAEQEKTCTKLLKSLMRISDNLLVSLTDLSDLTQTSRQLDERIILHDPTSEMINDGVPEMLGDSPNHYPMEYDATSQRLTSEEQQARTIDQYFDTSRLENYVRQCKNCMEQIEADSCPMNNQVLEMKKWATQLQELISFGCQSTENCGSARRCCVSDQAPFAITIVQMTQMLKDVYNMMLHGCRKCADLQNPSSPKTQWSEWSQCQGNSPGEPGTRSRQRSRPCDVGSSSSCVAQEVENESCQLTGQGCCYPGQWSGWIDLTVCSVTCGPGVRRRLRTCQQMVPGTICGPDRADVETQVAPCDNMPICEANPIQQSVRWDVSKCDCKTGLALCIHRTQGVVQASQCERYLGSKRKCNNVDDQCPECITSCRGRAPGLYPSCSSCAHYVKCSSTNSDVYACPLTTPDSLRSPTPMQFDAKKERCVQGTSPTCRLGTVLEECSTNTPDGFYHTKLCSEVIECRNGQTRIVRCPPVQLWDMYAAGCTGRSLTCPRKDFIEESDKGPDPHPPPVAQSGIIIGAVLE